MDLAQIQKDLVQAMQQEQFWHDRANFLRGQVSVLEAAPQQPPNRAERRRSASNGKLDPTPDPTPGP